MQISRLLRPGNFAYDYFPTVSVNQSPGSASSFPEFCRAFYGRDRFQNAVTSARTDRWKLIGMNEARKHGRLTAKFDREEGLTDEL